MYPYLRTVFGTITFLLGTLTVFSSNESVVRAATITPGSLRVIGTPTWNVPSEVTVPAGATRVPIDASFEATIGFEVQWNPVLSTNPDCESELIAERCFATASWDVFLRQGGLQTFAPGGGSGTQEVNETFFSEVSTSRERITVNGSGIRFWTAPNTVRHTAIVSVGFSPGQTITIQGPTTRVLPVPEPFTIFGSATALGIGAVFKRKYSKRLKKAKVS